MNHEDLKVSRAAFDPAAIPQSAHHARASGPVPQNHGRCTINLGPIAKMAAELEFFGQPHKHLQTRNVPTYVLNTT